jgi:3-dehydroquinate synthetase
LGFCDESSLLRIQHLIERMGLPTEFSSGLSLHRLAGNIEVDKKSSEGKVKFVCCAGIGATRFHRLSPQEIVNALTVTSL